MIVEEASAEAARLKKLLEYYVPPFFLVYLKFCSIPGTWSSYPQGPYPSWRRKQCKLLKILACSPLEVWGPFLLLRGEEKTQRHHLSQHNQRSWGLQRAHTPGVAVLILNSTGNFYLSSDPITIWTPRNHHTLFLILPFPSSAFTIFQWVRVILLNPTSGASWYWGSQKPSPD